jgi:hypothetical protein
MIFSKPFMQPFFLNHNNKGVSKKVKRNTNFSAKYFYDTASLRSARGLYKPIAYIYEKIFLFLVLIPIKQFQKQRCREIYYLSMKTLCI